MMPSAPGLVSMITGWPSCWPSGCAKMRAPSSAAPPGGNGTIRRIGLFGYCASEEEQTSAATTAASILRMALLRLYANGLQDPPVGLQLRLGEGAELFGRGRSHLE